MENFELLINKINADLKENLTEYRYNHSIGVMKKAEELALMYGIDVEKAKLVGLAHDIGKEIPSEEMLKFTKEKNIEIDEVEKINIGLLHAKIGAYMCKEKYGFFEDMCEAIEYHTTGYVGMSDLAKVLFVADKTEDGRGFKDLEYVQNLSKQSLDKALLYIIDFNIKDMVEKGELIHPESIRLRNELLVTM